MILSEWQPTNIFGFQFTGQVDDFKANSRMGRGFLLAEYLLPNCIKFYVATSHFESLFQREDIANRRAQIKDVFNLLKDEPNSIVVGDFNFDDPAEYKRNVIDNRFVDKAIGINQTMLATKRYKGWQPDKICIPENSQLIVSNVQKIGHFCIAPYENDRPEDTKKDGIHRMPSDHIGLICDVKLPITISPQ